MPVNKLEIEISKFAKSGDYSFSSEDDGKKRVYIIYSSELRKRLQLMISPFGTFASGNIHYKGENSQGDRILYCQNADSDQLTLISREAIISEEKEMSEDEKILAESEKLIAELEQRKIEWKKREKELGILPNYNEKHFWLGKDKDNNIVYEGMYVKSETQSHLITLENKRNNISQTQKITDEKVEQNDKEAKRSLSDDKEVNSASCYQIPPKK